MRDKNLRHPRGAALAELLWRFTLGTNIAVHGLSRLIAINTVTIARNANQMIGYWRPA
jgi:hypothetical protein